MRGVLNSVGYFDRGMYAREIEVAVKLKRKNNRSLNELDWYGDKCELPSLYSRINKVRKERKNMQSGCSCK